MSTDTTPINDPPKVDSTPTESYAAYLDNLNDKLIAWLATQNETADDTCRQAATRLRYLQAELIRLAGVERAFDRFTKADVGEVASHNYAVYQLKECAEQAESALAAVTRERDALKEHAQILERDLRDAHGFVDGFNAQLTTERAKVGKLREALQHNLRAYESNNWKAVSDNCTSALALAAQSGDGWVETMDRLPEDGQRVWACEKETVWEATFFSKNPEQDSDDKWENRFRCPGGYAYYGGITHWQPREAAPLPPKGGAK